MDFFSRTYTFWAGLAGGCFLTTASHGTDQLMVQRLLSARNERQSRAALLASWVVIFVQFTLFLLIGVLLFVYYGDRHLAAPAQMDRIYPEFVWNQLPAGVAGLVIAAILAAAMANLSAALNSLASTTVVDFLRPRVRGHRARAGALKAGAPGDRRLGAGAAGHRDCGAPFALGAGGGPDHRLDSFGRAAGSFPAGRADEEAARRCGHGRRGGGAGGDTLRPLLDTRIAFTWYVLIGTVVTFAAWHGVAVSIARPNDRTMRN